MSDELRTSDPAPSAEPTFSAAAAAALMGDKSGAVRWLRRSKILGDWEGASAADVRIAPAVLLEYVRTRVDEYDPRLIADDALRALALGLDAADPLVGIDQVAREAKVGLDRVRALIRTGAIPIVLRCWKAGNGSPRRHVRRSRVPEVLEAIRAAYPSRRGADERDVQALDLLHELLALREVPRASARAPIAAADGELTTGQLRGRVYPPICSACGAQTEKAQNVLGQTILRCPGCGRESRPLGQPRHADRHATAQPRCPRCSSRMLRGHDDDSDAEVWSCMACGVVEAARADAVAASE